MEFAPAIRVAKKDNVKALAAVLATFANRDCYLTLRRRKLLISDTFNTKADVSQYFDLNEAVLHSLAIGPYEEIVLLLYEVKMLVASIKFGHTKAKSVEMVFDLDKEKLRMVCESGFPKLTTL